MKSGAWFSAWSRYWGGREGGDGLFKVKRLLAIWGVRTLVLSIYG